MTSPTPRGMFVNSADWCMKAHDHNGATTLTPVSAGPSTQIEPKMNSHISMGMCKNVQEHGEHRAWALSPGLTFLF